MTRRWSLAALGFSALLAVMHTWPLATDPAGLSRLDNADTALNTWIVSWVAHQLPRDPGHVFDAPIFHPERRTLAYSEHLLAQGALAIPLRRSGASATLTYNVLALAGFTLSAWAMWLLVGRWTGDPSAGAVAGLAFAFNAHLLTRYGHLQTLHLEFVPLVLLAMDRLATRARWRDGLLLGLGITLVGLTSIYLLVFVAGATIVGLAARMSEWRQRPAATARATVLGIVMSVALLAPVLWPYWVVSHEQALVRSLEETARYGATWRDYLASGGRLHHHLWSARFFEGSAVLFPGVTVLLLAAAALLDPVRPVGRVRMLGAIALLGVLLSLGPALPLYGWLYDAVPLLGATRVASRWGLLFLMAAAVLAGLGMAAVRRRVRPAALRTALACVVPLIITAEALRAPMSFTPTPPIPAIYAKIASLPNAVLLEFPLFPGSHFNLNAPYLLAQTEHFRPVVAGYSGFSTSGYAARVARLGTFPGDVARAQMHDIGVTHVVLHKAPLIAGYGQAALDRVADVTWLTLEFEDETALVYRVTDQ